MFQEPKWAGEQHTFVAVGAGANVTGGRSAILGENVWAKVVVAGEERVIRGGGGGAVRDFTEKPWGLKSQDFEKVEVKEVQSGQSSSRRDDVSDFFRSADPSFCLPLSLMFHALFFWRLLCSDDDWIEHERDLCVQGRVRRSVVREVQGRVLWVELLS